MKKKIIPKIDEFDKKGIDPIDAYEAFIRKYEIPEYLNISNKKYIRFAFREVLDKPSLPTNLTDIHINKKAFANKLGITVKYINYFIEYFDKEDELMVIYFTMMFYIMTEREFSVDNFIGSIKEHFTTDTMIKKVTDLVSYNIDPSLVEEPDAKLMGDRKFDVSIQLTFDHLCCIMAISIMHKLIIPIVSQYVNMCSSELTKEGMTEKDLYFKVFTSFFDIFDDIYDVNIYNKIHHTAITRVGKTSKSQKLMWDRRKNLGVTTTSFINKIMKDLFVEITQKAIFTKSTIKFIHVCFDMSTKNELRQQDTFEYVTMSMESSDNVNEEVTAFDKMVISNARISEKEHFQSKIIIRDLINRLAEEYDIEFTDEEMLFYRDNIKLDEAQLILIFLTFTPYARSYNIMKKIKTDDLIKLIIIMKRMLRDSIYIYLPHIITGRIDTSKSKRFNKNKIKQFITKHPIFDSIAKEYSFSSVHLPVDIIIEHIKTLISCDISVVDFDYRDKLGCNIALNEVAVIDELVRLIHNL